MDRSPASFRFILLIESLTIAPGECYSRDHAKILFLEHLTTVIGE